jgi:3-hydroxy-9,10-secoandrosta-1,3,5(10)-triene-9,17-dione monooxygenase reductase component
VHTSRDLDNGGNPAGARPLTSSEGTSLRERQDEITKSDFRAVVGHFATGVAVVTADGPEGPAGLTTNAFSSVSLDPLLVLVCIDRGSRTLPVVQAAGRFAVNVLPAGGEELARIFASKTLVGREKFEAVTHRVEYGVPVLDEALAWLACDLTELVDAGDHRIALGAVTHAGAREGEPLVFFRGGYVPPS